VNFRSRRLATILTLALAGMSAPVFVFAAGTEGKPASSAAASKPTEKPASAADAGPSDGGLGPVDGSTLPPGHPPVGDELPPGHPNVGANPHGDPHADDEEDPHGQRGGGFFEAPPDTAVDDPSLPPGTIVVMIKDAEDRPIPKASAVIGILESSIAKGDTRKRKAIEMDAEGAARVDGLSVGGSTSYRVSTTRDSGSYASAPFNLSDKAGKRVIVHAYQATSDLDGVLVGMQAFVGISLREDSLTIQHMFNVYNIGKTAWVPDLNGAKVTLPDGYKAFDKPEGMADVQFVEGKNNEASLAGTIGPGQSQASFTYRLPLDGTDRQTIRIALPPRVGEVRVLSETGKTMGLSVEGFPAAQKRRDPSDGRNVMITARQAAPGERGIRTLDITITGLPTPGPGRWLAVLGAFSALLLAGVYMVKQADGTDTTDEVRSDLLEAREALLGEFVALEKAHRSGEIGPKTYARVRRGLLDALARIEAKLDGVRTPGAERRRQVRAARAGAQGEGDAS
jgi:hypothetical protein